MPRRPEPSQRDFFIERFAGNLIRARHAAGLSQGMLGVAAGLHTTEISKLERGQRIPRLDTAFRLSSALGVSVGVLVAGITWEAAPEREAGRFEGAEISRPSREGR